MQSIAMRLGRSPWTSRADFESSWPTYHSAPVSPQCGPPQVLLIDDALLSDLTC